MQTAPPQTVEPVGYELDLALWSETQAQALERRDASLLDWENLAEEIRAMSRSDRRAIKSNLKLLLIHLFKWALQPERRSTSWKLTIRNSRTAIQELLAESPSLRQYPTEVFEDVLADAYLDALTEMGMEDTSLRPNWPLTDVLNPNFLPEPVAPQTSQL